MPGPEHEEHNRQQDNQNFGDIKQNDIIEAFVTERVATEVFA